MSKKKQSLILGIMCLVLTIGICLQVKTVNNNGTTVGANEKVSELKSQVLKMKEKYENSYEKLEKVEEELKQTRENVTSNNEELKSLEEEIKKANILLGRTEVKGQGATITVEDADTVSNPNLLVFYEPTDLIIHDNDILGIINELRNAGAEAIEVNGQRIVETTAISCAGNVISINGEKVTSPFTINAIGLPELLTTLTRTNGYLDNLNDYQIKTTFKKQNEITIPKYTGIMNFKYAKSAK